MPSRRHQLLARAVLLTYVEQPGPIDCYPLLPLVPEARVDRRRTLELLR